MKYNLEFSGKDCNDEKYTMLGTVEISESKCFQYGNGKVIKFNLFNKSHSYSYAVLCFETAWFKAH